MKKIIYLIFVLLVFSAFSITEQTISEGVDNRWDNIYKVENVSRILYKNSYGFILNENEYKEDNATDLILHFNDVYRESINILGNYTAEEVSYIPNLKEKKLGAASANFSLQHHKISLKPKYNSLFASDSKMGSYSIDFWVYPQSLYEGNTIFSFYGPSYIQEYDKIDYSGIKCYYTGNQIYLEFANIYHIGNEPIKFKIDTNLKLEIGKWQHIAFSYNDTTGKFLILKNGSKKRIVWLTDTGNENGTLLKPYISPYVKHSLVIGESFFGNIDEFHISRQFKEIYEARKYVEEHGVLYSKVIDMKYSGSEFKKFLIEYKNEFQTEIIAFVRCSESIFIEDNNEIEWIEISKVDKLKGRYLQWKLMLLDSYNGEYSPVLYDFKYIYAPNYPPVSPRNLRYSITEDGRVKVEWDKNVELDLKGYYVYYGPKSHYYICGDSIEGSSPIFTKENFIYLTLPKYTQYYVSIKAVDNSYGEQKSEFSEEILIRSK